jgi:creatinine amidohydrolase
MPGKIIESMTWDEIQDVLPTVQAIIISLGAKSKEHGFHLPMNTDYIQAKFFRDEILKHFDKVLAAPTIAYSHYPAFLNYPGSISLSIDTAMNMFLDICRSLHAQGLIIFIF